MPRTPPRAPPRHAQERHAQVQNREARAPQRGLAHVRHGRLLPGRQAGGDLSIESDLVGSFASGALDAVAMVLSVAWQYGLPFRPTVEKLRGMGSEPQGATGDAKYGLVKSPLDYVARWLLDRFGARLVRVVSGTRRRVGAASRGRTPKAAP